MKVALVHDALTQRGGAERALLSLHRLFPDAPIYTSVFDPEGTYPEFASARIETSFLQRLPHRGGWVRVWLPFYPLVFDRMRLRGYDVVISSSSHFAHGVRAAGAVHICYCYTPPRWLYRTKDYFGDGGLLPGWAQVLLAPLLGVIRRWDRRASSRPDLYAAISSVIAGRIARLYGRESVVIYPPVDTDRFESVDRSDITLAEDPFYLVVSRLLPYKRVDLPIKACSEIGARLLVVGDGPARRRLESIAGPTVEFLGQVEEGRLISMLGRCRALIHAGEEDFGLAPLEANAAGRPAIAFAGGGAAETVVDSKTGVLFHSQTSEELLDALRRAEGIDWDPAVLRAHAGSFGEDRFRSEFSMLVDGALTSARASIAGGVR